jgi:CelD/BcsL family acetyltransferase involved in cellulose biosynthesis
MVSMAAHLVVLAWAIGAFGLAAGAFARRRITALGPTVIVVVTLYLFDFLAAAWRPLAAAAVISPFHYYQGISLLAGTTHSERDLAVLGSMTLAATAIAYWRFCTRDV